MLQNLRLKNLQCLQVLLCAANQIRTDTPVVWALPPQGSASTNFAIAAFCLKLKKRPKTFFVPRNGVEPLLTLL